MRCSIPTGKKLAVPTGSTLVVPTTEAGYTPPIDYAVACCYGLRTLKVGYAGALIRLRRSSDDAESDFSAVDGVIDTAAIATWLGGSTGYVAKWYDQSGNTRDVSQGTHANQPQFVASYNGKPALLSGATDYLQVLGFSVAQPRTINAVFAHTASSVEYLLDSANNPARSVMRPQASPAGAFSIWSGSAYVTGTTSVYGGNTFAVHTEFNGASSEIWLNGSSEATGDPGATSMTGISIGSAFNGSSNWLGHYMEVIVVGSILSSGDRTTLYNDQDTYYGIP